MNLWRVIQTALALVIITANASAQPPMDWEQTYGGTEWDYGFSVHQIEDGSIFLKGATTSFGAGDRDLFLVKTDSQGNQLWQQTFGGSEYESCCDLIIQTDDDNVIIGGITESFGIGEADFYLVKTDLDGNQLWANTYGTTNYDHCFGLCQGQDGGYLMCGCTWGGDPHDFYFIKADADGNLEWELIQSYPDWDICLGVRPTSDGGFIGAGYTRSFSSSDDGYLIKMDALGNVEWDQHYAGYSWDYFFDVVETPDGEFVAAGYTDPYSGGPAQMWAVKTDASGNEIWNHTYGGSAEERCYSLQLSSDGGYYLCGGTTDTASGLYDSWLVKINSNGNIAWDATYGDDDDELCRSLFLTDEGGFLIGGYKTPSGGNPDAYVAYVAGECPDLMLTLTPHNPPIEIPAEGGEFQFDIEIAQSGIGWCTCDICIDVTLPGGITLSILQRDDIVFYPEQMISRQDLTQQVPGTAPAGTYTYHAYAWDASTWTVYAEDSFTFEKLSGGDGLAPHSNWTLSGWKDIHPQAETVTSTHFNMNAYPNPFNPSTMITYQLSEVYHVNLAVYDVSGRQITELVNGRREAGLHKVTFDASNLPSGVYLAQLNTGSTLMTQKLLLIK